MIVKNLSETPLDELIACFLIAFENYYVKMPTDKAYYENRWKAAKVDFSLSYGMFVKDKLVGFIIHAVDTRRGVLTAFNTGTGVIPDYRGRRVVKAIYEYALRDLRAKQIAKSTLEVIIENELAIKAYQSIGFKISKTYKCFAGDIQLKEPGIFALEELKLEDVNWDHLPGQNFYSWDFQKETILKANYRVFQVLFRDEPDSFFIINTANHYLAQFDLFNDDKSGWLRLFSAIKYISSVVKVINVDTRLDEKLNQLEKVGLQNTVNQYEMEIDMNFE